MMKVPNSIKAKMRKAAKAFGNAHELMREIDDYFIEQGFDIDELRSGNGISLEELEAGNDITDEFCDWVEESENGKLKRLI